MKISVDRPDAVRGANPSGSTIGMFFLSISRLTLGLVLALGATLLYLRAASTGGTAFATRAFGAGAEEASARIARRVVGRLQGMKYNRRHLHRARWKIWPIGGLALPGTEHPGQRGAEDRVSGHRVTSPPETLAMAYPAPSIAAARAASREFAADNGWTSPANSWTARLRRPRTEDGVADPPGRSRSAANGPGVGLANGPRVSCTVHRSRPLGDVAHDASLASSLSSAA